MSNEGVANGLGRSNLTPMGYKARLMVCGFSQVDNIDFEEIVVLLAKIPLSALSLLLLLQSNEPYIKWMLIMHFF